MDAASSALRPFGADLWLADGVEVDVAGFRYPTRAVVVRRPDGGLFVWSPVALSAALHAGIEALGPVHHVVAPNALHHLFLREWREAYPMAKFHAPPGLRGKRPDIAFDGDPDDGAASPWAPTGAPSSRALSAGSDAPRSHEKGRRGCPRRPVMPRP